MADEHDTDNDVIMSQEHDTDDQEGWEDEEVAIEEIEEVEIVEGSNLNPEAPDFADEDEGAFGDDNEEDFADDGDGDGGWGDDDGDGGWGDDDEVADINGDEAIMSCAKEKLFETTIPSITTKTLSSNCDEVNMIPLFAAAPDLKSRSRIGAMVAIRVANLTNITTDQLEVWGLTPEFPFIALKVVRAPCAAQTICVDIWLVVLELSLNSGPSTSTRRSYQKSRLAWCAVSTPRRSCTRSACRGPSRSGSTTRCS